MIGDDIKLIFDAILFIKEHIDIMSENDSKCKLLFDICMGISKALETINNSEFVKSLSEQMIVHLREVVEETSSYIVNFKKPGILSEFLDP